MVDLEEVNHEYGIQVYNSKSVLADKYSAVVLAVSHNEFLEIDLAKIKNKKSILFDIKGFLPQDLVDAKL